MRLPPTHEIEAKDLQVDDYTIWSGSGWECVVEVETEDDGRVHFLLQYGDGCVVDPSDMLKIRRPCRTLHVFPDGEVL